MVGRFHALKSIATTHQGFQAGTATKLLHICKNLKILYWFQGEAKKTCISKNNKIMVSKLSTTG